MPTASSKELSKLSLARTLAAHYLDKKADIIFTVKKEEPPTKPEKGIILCKHIYWGGLQVPEHFAANQPPAWVSWRSEGPPVVVIDHDVVCSDIARRLYHVGRGLAMLVYSTLHPGDDARTYDATALVGYLAGLRILDWYVPPQDPKRRDEKQRAEEEGELAAKIGGFRAVFNGSRDARAYYKAKRTPLVRGLDRPETLSKDTLDLVQGGICKGDFSAPEACAQRLYFSAQGMTYLVDYFVNESFKLDPKVLCGKIERMTWRED
jgi:hypothetical protein